MQNNFLVCVPEKQKKYFRKRQLQEGFETGLIENLIFVVLIYRTKCCFQGIPVYIAE